MDAKLETKDGVYLLMSTGGDPTAAPASSGPVGPFAISFKMKSNSRSSGQVFRANADDKEFHLDRSATFELIAQR